MEIKVDRNLFAVWLQTKRLSNRSIFEYVSYFDKFDFGRFNQEYINLFISRFKGNSVVGAFLNNLFMFIKRTTNYPDEVKECVSKLYVESSTGRRIKKILRVITEKQMRDIAIAFDIRNQLILYLSFYCGLRRSELFGDVFNEEIKPLTYEHFNITAWNQNRDSDAELNIKGKGNRSRSIPVPAWLMKKVYKFGHDNQKNRKDIVFDIKKRRWAEVLEKTSDNIIGFKLHPHDLRASCAVWLFIACQKDIVEVMEILGHDNLSTTQKYLKVSNKMRERYFNV